jgi:hypothetical protein
MSLRIYAESSQPMTRFTDPHVPGEPLVITMDPRRQVFTDCCRKRRWAKNVRVQVYYDCLHRFCADGHGCRRKAVRHA